MNYDKCMRKECKRCKDYTNCFKEDKKKKTKNNKGGKEDED